MKTLPHRTMNKNYEYGLIGHTGFVGSCLKKQHYFDMKYNRQNIDQIKDDSFETVICAGASATKWIANKYPDEDRKNIKSLTFKLDQIKCKHFILISTVDVFSSPVSVDENTRVDKNHLQPYGLHRYELEEFAKSKFKKLTIVRLSNLVGPGLKKNIIYDFHNNHETWKIDCRNKYQFYPMVNLFYDIKTALQLNLSLVHCTAEPLSVKEVATEAFNLKFSNITEFPVIDYDFRSISACEMGSKVPNYTYTKRESIQAIRTYSQSEPKALKSIK